MDGVGKIDMNNPSSILPIAQYAARSRDDAVLRVSSSGGVFTEIARIVLSKKGVVVAAGWNRATMTVEHRCVETEEELSDLRGSKYISCLAYMNLWGDLLQKAARCFSWGRLAKLPPFGIALGLLYISSV